MIPTNHFTMVFQFNHSISLKFTEEKGFFMRFALDLLDLDEKKRNLLAKDYIKDWILQELEIKLQAIMKKLETDPPAMSELDAYKFHQFNDGNTEE